MNLFAWIVIFGAVALIAYNLLKKDDPFNPDDLQYFDMTIKDYYANAWPKRREHGQCIDFWIAGITYRENIDSHLGECKGRLVPEPNNPHDRFAIRIEAPDGFHLGYVPRDMTAEIREYKQLPCECFCLIIKHRGRYVTDCYVVL